MSTVDIITRMHCIYDRICRSLTESSRCRGVSGLVCYVLFREGQILQLSIHISGTGVWLWTKHTG